MEKPSLEELAIRFAILVSMPKEQFSGHEEELGMINEQLWDHFGGRILSEAITEAKQTLRLVTL